MYEALGTAARSGMEKVVRLLLSAGNEVRFLEGNVSLSKLMSKAKIS
jgi:SpoU rRNA methylase family enzyme